MIVHTSEPMPTIDKATPRGSMPRTVPRDSGMRVSAATMATIAIGTLMRNTAPQK